MPEGEQGTRAVTSSGRGDGTFTSRSLARSKRKYLQIPSDYGLHRDFGAKAAHVIARRRNVATLWRGGASPREILQLINEDLVQQNQSAARLGLDRKPLAAVSLATIRADIQHVKAFIRAEFHYAIEHGADEIIAAMLENVRDARGLKAKAQGFKEEAIAIVTLDNAARSFLKVIGVSSDVSVEVRKTELKATFAIDGAPPEVRSAQVQRVIEAEVFDAEPDGLG